MKRRLYKIKFRDANGIIKCFRTTAASPRSAAKRMKRKGTILSVTKQKNTTKSYV